MLLGELLEPLVLPEAPPLLLAPELPDVAPLELCSLRHFSFSAPIMLSQRLLPVPADDVPLPEPMLVPLEVVPVPALGAVVLLLDVLGLVLLLGVLGLVLLLEVLGVEVLEEEDPVTPVPALPAVPVSPLRVEVPALPLGVVVVPALLDVPVPMVLPEVPVLDLVVAPAPLSEAQPAPKATRAAAVAAASSFNVIRILLLDMGCTRKVRTRLEQDTCRRAGTHLAPCGACNPI